ncbi:MAG: hypothetical protein RML93_08625 [Anaerolineales bacterium]|nr:YckD family protein [Anaerolineales bacterium]MCS7246736.1 YckD family protein [Anaerolineales bacterium]MDW8160546.1 hypothetical protein [Anaerolineales bacterium]MDW8447341.1 hypothetical protein [Anaerolineales bacterium]
MLRILMLIALGAVIGVVILGIAGIAFAQTQTPPGSAAPNSQLGVGCWNVGGMRMGHWSQSGRAGLIRRYFIAAVAPKLGMSAEALEAELAAGKTLWQVAQAQGIAWAEFRALVVEARKEALSKMVTDGVITQAQADWMLSHLERMFRKGGRFDGWMGPCCGGGWFNPQGRQTPTPTPGSGY